MSEKDAYCRGDHCGRCCGGDMVCPGCAVAVELTPEERDFLLLFADSPFLPLAKEPGGGPVYLTEDGSPIAETAAIIAALTQKRLLQLDYDMPLLNYDYSAYQDFPERGSMALTALGQQLIDDWEIQG